MGKVRSLLPAIDAAEKRLIARCKKYGITPQQYRVMGAIQGWACALCRKVPAPGKRPLEIDHDHKIGRVRGLLCWFCNHKRVGRARTDNDALIYERLAAYLRSGFDARDL